jgi:hypothetical protein
VAPGRAPPRIDLGPSPDLASKSQRS